MSTAVSVGKETTHGTVAAAFTSVPCNFDATLRQNNKFWEEDRSGQDRNFAMTPGQRYIEWQVGETGFYHDTTGFFLCSAMGVPTKTTVDTIFDNVFKFTDDPASLSMKWQQPRRYTQAYQSLNCVADKFAFQFSAEGDLTWSASGMGLGESEVSQITHSFSTARPLPAWAGTILLNNGAFAKLVSGSVSMTRNRKPFYTINNTQSPNSMSIGARTVEFEIVVDFSAKTEYDYFKAGTTLSTGNKGLNMVWTDTGVTIGTTSNPTLTINMGTVAFETGEIDTGSDFPLVKLSGKALYNSTDASLAVVTIRSSKDYVV
jgi:hypothetical protein